METILGAKFRAKAAETKDLSMSTEMTYSVSYPTGFLNIDFANGYVQNINGNIKYELGISDGSMNEIISDSGVGKTTLATQAACNIIRPFKNGIILYEQAEVGTNIQRIKNLTGFTDEEFKARFIVRDAGITTESIYKRVKLIYELKLANKEEYLYDTGLKDLFGKPVLKFEPTVIIVDSLKMVKSEKSTEQDEVNNMSAAQEANNNSQYYSKMLPMCKLANIIIFTINHITTDINTGFMPKKSQFAYMKQGEYISGSKTFHYMQNNILRLDIKSKLKEDEGFGISGSIVTLDVVKSRTNTSSRGKCNLVFNMNAGYDNDLSLLLMLKERKLLEGAATYKLPGCDTKFTMKKFKDILYGEGQEEFRNAFVKLCIDTLVGDMLAEYNKVQEEKHNSSTDIYYNMLNSVTSS